MDLGDRLLNDNFTEYFKMTISLKKNQGISLSKTTNSLSTVVMGLGWDAFMMKEVKIGGIFGMFGSTTGKKKKVPMDVDLDASCLLMDKNGNALESIYFNKLTSRCKNVKHTGDNRTGDGDGDDEQIKVNLESLPSNVEHVVFVVNAFSRNVSFNNVENAFCRLFNGRDGKEMVRTELDASGTHTAIVMAKVSRMNGDWQFTSLLEPCDGRTVGQVIPVAKKIIKQQG